MNLNNTVIEVLDKEHGQKVKKFFQEMELVQVLFFSMRIKKTIMPGDITDSSLMNLTSIVGHRFKTQVQKL